MKIFKTKVFALFFPAFFGLLFLPLVASAESALTGLGEASKNTGLGTENLPTMIGKIVGALLSFVGVLFLILMIYGGIMWMTARGNEQQVEKARSLIVAAIIGIIITLAAYAITMFVGNILTT